MKNKSRIVVVLLELGLLLFGLLCLNYTNAWNLERHTLRAEEYGIPAPSQAIHYAGMGVTALAGILLGRGLRSRS